MYRVSVAGRTAICWRFLDLTVWSASVIHRALGCVHRADKCLSFAAVERLNEVTVDWAECSGKVMVKESD